MYASEIIEELKNSEIIVVEGTVYPLLSRLKIKLHTTRMEGINSRSSRKYYSITNHGLKHLKELVVSWSDINSSVKKLFKTKK